MVPRGLVFVHRAYRLQREKYGAQRDRSAIDRDIEGKAPG
jgi:hypothetical protein